MSLAKFLAIFLVFAVLHVPALATKKSYVVYLGGHSHGPDVSDADFDRVTDSHTQLLASFLGSEEKAKDAMFVSYKRHINGFAALLEEEEAKVIAKHPSVVSVFENQAKKLHTTRSWEFLGLEKHGPFHPYLARKGRYGEDTIIATIDSGVWPESKSFSPKRYGPIPSRWKGTCQVDKNTTFCNRKIIGARYFNKGYAAYTGVELNSSYHTPRDYTGHGSHTLSTAAGNFVPKAHAFNLGKGTAGGGSPRARVASYNVCWDDNCIDSDIMEAFDMAINDGVDVLSMSLGGYAMELLYDSTAIGSFHAVMNGIVVVASAGNSGPLPGTVTNVAPWILTVAASTIDREFQADVILKNGSFFKGISLSKPLQEKGFYPLIKAVDARAANVSKDDAPLCIQGTLNPKKVKGKIVVCESGGNVKVAKSIEAARAGAAGMILVNGVFDVSDNIADPYVLPATSINYSDGLILLDYINSTKNPEGLITSTKTVLNTKPAPYMAFFSSRGPNLINPQILKPDITAPGVNIVAAYSEGVSPSGLASDKRITPFNIMSGTSMACPHVSGVVGLLKTLHPDWSPAAIKSAIMTTARTRDNTNSPIQDFDLAAKGDPFAYGSGHLRPNRAMDPGLVYDLSPNDYLDFLCGNGYDNTMIAKFTGSSNYNCPEKYNILDFNYPSITVLNINETATVRRKVKNVGWPGTYVARVHQPLDYSISVEPETLKFDKYGEEKSFTLTIKERRPRSKINGAYEFGQLIWSDGIHNVRSPIVVLPK